MSRYRQPVEPHRVKSVEPVKLLKTHERAQRLREQGQIVLRYALPNGDPAAGSFPWNPNGSQDDIAGICDPTGRIFGLMPHPEAYHSPLLHPLWNHQRRFGAQFRQAKALADGGAIGDLVRLESFTSNLYDWGTHWFDMMFFYNGDVPAEWVIGQIDGRGGRQFFGATVEGQGLCLIRYRNGVYGLMVTGQAFMDPEVETREERCANRLIGSEGTIGSGNVISGNGGAGIVGGSGSTGIVIRRNLIGTDASGMAPLGNAVDVEEDLARLVLSTHEIVIELPTVVAVHPLLPR